MDQLFGFTLESLIVPKCFIEEGVGLIRLEILKGSGEIPRGSKVSNYFSKNTVCIFKFPIEDVRNCAYPFSYGPQGSLFSSLYSVDLGKLFRTLHGQSIGPLHGQSREALLRGEKWNRNSQSEAGLLIKELPKLHPLLLYAVAEVVFDSPDSEVNDGERGGIISKEENATNFVSQAPIVIDVEDLLNTEKVLGYKTILVGSRDMHHTNNTYSNTPVINTYEVSVGFSISVDISSDIYRNSLLLNTNRNISYMSNSGKVPAFASSSSTSSDAYIEDIKRSSVKINYINERGEEESTSINERGEEDVSLRLSSEDVQELVNATIERLTDFLIVFCPSSATRAHAIVRRFPNSEVPIFSKLRAKYKLGAYKERLISYVRWYGLDQVLLESGQNNLCLLDLLTPPLVSSGTSAKYSGSQPDSDEVKMNTHIRSVVKRLSPFFNKSKKMNYRDHLSRRKNTLLLQKNLVDVLMGLWDDNDEEDLLSTNTMTTYPKHSLLFARLCAFFGPEPFLLPPRDRINAALGLLDERSWLQSPLAASILSEKNMDHHSNFSVVSASFWDNSRMKRRFALVKKYFKDATMKIEKQLIEDYQSKVTSINAKRDNIEGNDESPTKRSVVTPKELLVNMNAIQRVMTEFHYWGQKIEDFDNESNHHHQDNVIKTNTNEQNTTKTRDRGSDEVSCWESTVSLNDLLTRFLPLWNTSKDYTDYQNFVLPLPLSAILLNSPISDQSEFASSTAIDNLLCSMYLLDSSKAIPRLTLRKMLQPKVSSSRFLKSEEESQIRLDNKAVKEYDDIFSQNHHAISTLKLKKKVKLVLTDVFASCSFTILLLESFLVSLSLIPSIKERMCFLEVNKSAYRSNQHSSRPSRAECSPDTNNQQKPKIDTNNYISEKSKEPSNWVGQLSISSSYNHENSLMHSQNNQQKLKSDTNSYTSERGERGEEASNGFGEVSVSSTYNQENSLMHSQNNQQKLKSDTNSYTSERGERGDESHWFGEVSISSDTSSDPLIHKETWGKIPHYVSRSEIGRLISPDLDIIEQTTAIGRGRINCIPLRPGTQECKEWFAQVNLYNFFVRSLRRDSLFPCNSFHGDVCQGHFPIGDYNAKDYLLVPTEGIIVEDFVGQARFRDVFLKCLESHNIRSKDPSQQRKYISDPPPTVKKILKVIPGSSTAAILNQEMEDAMEQKSVNNSSHYESKAAASQTSSVKKKGVSNFKSLVEVVAALNTPQWSSGKTDLISLLSLVETSISESPLSLLAEYTDNEVVSPYDKSVEQNHVSKLKFFQHPSIEVLMTDEGKSILKQTEESPSRNRHALKCERHGPSQPVSAAVANALSLPFPSVTLTTSSSYFTPDEFKFLRHLPSKLEDIDIDSCSPIKREISSVHSKQQQTPKEKGKEEDPFFNLNTRNNHYDHDAFAARLRNTGVECLVALCDVIVDSSASRGNRDVISKDSSSVKYFLSHEEDSLMICSGGKSSDSASVVSERCVVKAIYRCEMCKCVASSTSGTSTSNNYRTRTLICSPPFDSLKGKQSSGVIGNPNLGKLAQLFQFMDDAEDFVDNGDSEEEEIFDNPNVLKYGRKSTIGRRFIDSPSTQPEKEGQHMSSVHKQLKKTFSDRSHVDTESYLCPPLKSYFRKVRGMDRFRKDGYAGYAPVRRWEKSNGYSMDAEDIHRGLPVIDSFAKGGPINVSVVLGDNGSSRPLPLTSREERMLVRAAFQKERSSFSSSSSNNDVTTTPTNQYYQASRRIENVRSNFQDMSPLGLNGTTSSPNDYSSYNPNKEGESTLRDKHLRFATIVQNGLFANMNIASSPNVTSVCPSMRVKDVESSKKEDSYSNTPDSVSHSSVWSSNRSLSKFTSRPIEAKYNNGYIVHISKNIMRSAQKPTTDCQTLSINTPTPSTSFRSKAVDPLDALLGNSEESTKKEVISPSVWDLLPSQSWDLPSSKGHNQNQNEEGAHDYAHTPSEQESHEPNPILTLVNTVSQHQTQEQRSTDKSLCASLPDAHRSIGDLSESLSDKPIQSAFALPPSEEVPVTDSKLDVDKHGVPFQYYDEVGDSTSMRLSNNNTPLRGDKHENITPISNFYHNKISTSSIYDVNVDIEFFNKDYNCSDGIDSDVLRVYPLRSL